MRGNMGFKTEPGKEPELLAYAEQNFELGPKYPDGTPKARGHVMALLRVLNRMWHDRRGDDEVKCQPCFNAAAKHLHKECIDYDWAHGTKCGCNVWSMVCEVYSLDM